MSKSHQSEAWDSDSSEENTRSTCTHIQRAVDAPKLRRLLKGTGLVTDCTQCKKDGITSPAAEAGEALDTQCCFEYDTTLWLCLKCGTQLCGRARNRHALKHYETPRSDSHAIAMNTRTFEVWCYECDNDVKPKSKKNLLDIVEFVKGLAQKPPVATAPIENIESKIIGAITTMNQLVAGKEDASAGASIAGNKAIPLPPPPMPGMAKRVNEIPQHNKNTNTNLPPMPGLFGSSVTATTASMQVNAMAHTLPRARGLSNLGNTCFFNAVMQCLAQTPYLLDVLKESAESGEEFTLPGGTFKFKDKLVELPPINGTLAAWGGLTSALASTLEELQAGGGVLNPSRVFDKLCNKCPQFRGGDQHDSHELLRHLLESVRSEDLKRYQRVILQNLGCGGQDVKSVSEEMKQKCKIYGNQAADRILRPDQVFRGFLVSTLTCQDCYNVSSTHEYFLDMSLPVSVEKARPPQMRRKTSPDNANSFYLHPAPTTSPTGPTKAQLRKEAKKERKARRQARSQNAQHAQKQILSDLMNGGDADTAAAGDGAAELPGIGASTADDKTDQSASSSEQSYADVEDNLVDESEKGPKKPFNTSDSAAVHCDPNGNNQPATSPVEKRGDSPENIDKDSLDEDENDSGISNSPANAGASYPPSSASASETNGDTNTATNSVLSLGLSETGASLVRQLTLNDLDTKALKTADSAVANISGLTNGDVNTTDHGTAVLQSSLQQLNFKTDEDEQRKKKAALAKERRVRTQSYSDWSTTIAPRYQCEDNECSVQSCLNNFTAVELMTGNNKVSCDACTKRINGEDPKAKTIYTNATKQFLISSPPAVMILHLKRFQVGMRGVFRKLNMPVSFPMMLDVAPFCGSKVKNLPNIDRKQKKLLYALYGVVEHSGGMYNGHYTAYVKVRPKMEKDDQRWKFIPQGSKTELDQDDEQRKKLEELLAREKARDLRMKAANDSDDCSNSGNSNLDTSNTSSSTSSTSSEHEESSSVPTSPTSAEHDRSSAAGAVGGIEEASHVQMPMGKWYHISDSRVTDVSESQVLSAEAYLLFYERIY